MMTSEFVQGYLDCALWTSTFPDSEDPENRTIPMDRGYSLSDIAPEDMARMKAEASAFCALHEADLDTFEGPSREGPSYKCGVLLWLNRNRAGAGFWDGDFPIRVGDRLSAAAIALGEQDLYVGDDGQIFLYPPPEVAK